MVSDDEVGRGTLSPWPAMSRRNVPWDVHPVSGMTRHDRARIGRPHRAAVVPAIAGLPLVLRGRSAAEAEEAAAAMASFDGDVGNELLPFDAVLLRSESVASSQIEQLTASARRIAEAEVTGSGTDHAVKIVANTRAMRAALDLADSLDVDAVLRMHEVLMEHTEPDIAGRWRDDQVWVGGRARFGAGSPHEAQFVPPVAADVPGGMADLMEFVRRDDLPVVPQAAIAHAQFETIHPFSDGNGRVGRALLHAVLRAKGLVSRVSVPISSGLLTDTTAYVGALTAYRDGDVDAIVSAVARAALAGLANGELLLGDLEDVRRRWDDLLVGVRADSGARSLATGLLGRPVVTAVVARELLGGATNVHRHIQTLEERGILIRHQDHKSRNMTWRAQDVLDALDAYARRSGRRG